MRTRSLSLPGFGKKGHQVFLEGASVVPALDIWERVDLASRPVVLECRGREGLSCRDKLRVDLKAVFVVSLSRSSSAILDVIQNLGSSALVEPDTVEHLFRARFKECLATVVKQFDFEKLLEASGEASRRVKECVGEDLSGFQLESVALESVTQTPLECMDPEDLFDAEGICRITERSAAFQVATNRLRNWARKECKRDDVECREYFLKEMRRAEDEAKEITERVLQSQEEAL